MDNRYSRMKCTNCGKQGHSFKFCPEPKTSYGIIAIHVENNKILEEDIISSLRVITNISKEQRIICDNESNLRQFVNLKNAIKILLIMRKHTLGYMEFIRGRYNPSKPDQIKSLFEQMTPIEIQAIYENQNNFDFLWQNMWSSNIFPCTIRNINTHQNQKPPVNYNNQYRYGEYHKHNEFHTQNNQFKIQSKKICIDFDNAKSKFIKLQTETINLSDIVLNTEPLFDCPEWGFPKGRRISSESDICCAKREFAEETGYNDSDYILFDNIEPLVENLIGTDGINYRHVYYIALLRSTVIPSCNNIRKTQLCEIGGIGLFNMDEALQKIRPHHNIRKGIIYTVCSNILPPIINK